jgi:outer membrane protein OmpA-like peptidoglycan-associated protein
MTALLLGCGGAFVFADPAFTQTAPSPTQQTITTAQDGRPVFRVTVVGRTTPAINYRPRRGNTRVDFTGTDLMPDGEGRAEVSGQEGVIKIEVRLDDLEPPSTFGPEYLTYVLWAVTPEGRATNLGEVQFDSGDSASVDVTTELQTFGLILTAEPYFAVTEPSDVVVMENMVRDSTDGRVEAIVAKYQVRGRGTYLLNRPAVEVSLPARDPDVPLDLAQARNAVAIARFARSDRYARETFERAERLLNEAEDAHERGRRGNTLQQPAREAVQTAEDARIISLREQEAEFNAEQRRLAAEAAERARLEEERRRQAELAAAAEQRRAREAQVAADAEAARRRAAELEAQAAAAARQQAERDRLAAEQARADADAALKAAEAARLAAEQQARAAQEAADAAEREKAALREQLRLQLNAVLETRETARGLIVNVSDVLFDFDKATLRPGARERLARVAGILAAQPGLEVQVEGHTDSIGTDVYNKQLSDRRAASVRDYLVSNGIPPAAVGTAGLGESQPVATNETAAGRQMNRRVEIVVSGDAIDR